ncbi:protein Skeletor, isoforms B/C isoform X1 [Linepithema humile]|uniref:protein Skeletor, isoforms B/C isoform X1 n=1 Tax=Linepithema humile TaxID=83485 RepID=UPI0006237B30|nr:PREDICTED: protein Skeletor, isoforms B/C isoform X1 [Linepithema humile]XP_012227837.1 PREDICTED: protein Skeletor, isoforms B/C isoform X1 [Linepithema humile]XP_012227838.1 PREDICTED: protein Skeletor, isoforms B/C isoform X1 [Linepithema humile]XP_012227839.1 PREDICTED: protein Skeletor, isoforms B/C isoform X1 [Linepithema humile]XP_012227840.1 PREDICTED: protein Skeletor, isoforms B/C isoform X1 [Linepithema humile]XP_012227841.1 PREDICTED: protein Skeletor, isoforms B/C isoform X1 [L
MRERQRERDGNGEARRAGDRVVVGPTKLPGSTTDTFLSSNHQDTMTTRSLASSPARRPSAIGLITAFLFIVTAQLCSGAYYGKLISKLSEFHHGVSGEVYAVDARTLFIKDFTYDGEGPAAFFYAGSSKAPGNNGFRVRDERGTTNVLKRYRKKDITLTLPDGKTLNNIKWFSVWCDEFSVNFGDVRIPRGFDYPKPQKLKALSGIHGVSSEPVVIVDAQTLLIPSFSYDGEAPDAKFWVGVGPSPSSQGIRVPDENGKEQPLRRYSRKTIVLTLPDDLTVHQLGHFGVWCEAFAVDFGHVQIPQALNVPPSLKMLGVSPQSKLNCEVLEDSLAFEVRWAVAGDSIVVQLVAKLDAGQYMSFGVSADTEKSVMIGGDVAVAWVDKQTLQGYATDYFLDAKSQCSGRRGSCPDKRIQENTDSVRLLNAAMVNGYSIVTYQRPLKASDELDRPILTNRSQAIIWAIGPLNERQEVSFHSNYLNTDRFIDFSRPPAWNCPMPDQEQTSSSNDTNETAGSSNAQLVVTTRRPQRQPATPAPASTNDAWDIPPIQCWEPDDGVLYAQIGPTGGKHGYPAITGHVGWGISWYINGLLIPVINVVRGKRYTFVVEGGYESEYPARYHPFYITDDPIGGYQHKTPEEKAKVKIFAGVRRQRNNVIPTGVGRLCNWIHDQNKPEADDFATFGGFQRTLTLECDHGEPGIVEWTPDENTPDTVYYQCFSHRYLGWKINVLDSCDNPDEASSAASEKHEVYAAPPKGHQAASQDMEYGASVAITSKVMPPVEFLHQQHAHHSHREYSHRYPHRHSATNPAGKLNVSYHRHPQLLTNAANNKFDRLQSSSSSSSSSSEKSSYDDATNMITPHRSYEGRPKDHIDEDASQQQQQQQQDQMTAHEQSSSLYTDHLELAREIPHQTSATNQQLSNLVADHQRPSLIHGTKFPYVATIGGNAYSRAPHYYPSNHHVRLQLPLPFPRYHQHQPEPPRTQLMIIRRPVPLTRNPMLQTLQAATNALSLPFSFPFSFSFSSSPRPILIERKKSIYRPLPITSTLKVSTDKSVSVASPPFEKFTAKIDAKSRAKLEAKVGSEDISDNLMSSSRTVLKPARNTGFDPDSIVIEGGFKPIIRNVVDREPDVAQKRISMEDAWQDEVFRKTSDYQTIDEFSPVFVPSSPVTSVIGDDDRKQRKKTSQLARFSSQLDDLDDMETAADIRLDTYYLPPIGKTRPEQLPPSSSGVLITYDGKKLKDSISLTRSITDIDHRSKGRLTSDILSRTPQFGTFQGELPPLIPGEIRANSSTYGRKHQLLPKTSTRLTLVERSKRSPMSSVDFQRDSLSNYEDNRERERIDAVSGSGDTRLGGFGWIMLITTAAYLAI